MPGSYSPPPGILPLTRRSAFNVSAGGTSATTTQANVTGRNFLRLPCTTTRWRVKIRNYDIRLNAALAALTGVGIWWGVHAQGTDGSDTGNFTAAPQALVGAFAMPGDGTFYTSPWFTAANQQMVAGSNYVLSIAATTGGAATPIARGSYNSCVALNSTSGGTTAPSTALFAISLFDVSIEYEYYSTQPIAIFAGDSITEGYCGGTLSLPPYASWPSLVGMRSGISTINMGVLGRTTADFTSGTDGKWNKYDLTTYGPEIGVILLGSNDVSGAVALATTQANIATIAGVMRGFGVKRLYLGSVTPRSDFSGATETARGVYNAWQRTLPVGANGCFEFDRAIRNPASVATIDPDFVSSDGIHPVRAGYTVMANVVPSLRYTP